jgi:hypothetical protein
MEVSDAAPRSAQHGAEPPKNWGRGIFVAGCLILAVAEVYLLTNAGVRDPLHLPLGGLILFFAGLPGILWAKRGRATLPIFEVLMLTTANTYAFPLLNGHQELVYYVPEDVTTAALAVLCFQVVAFTVYEFVGGRPSTHPFWRDEVITGNIGEWLSYGMTLNSAFVVISTFTDWVPVSLSGILRAIFFGVGIVSAFITSRRLGAGQLSAGERALFVANLLVQCIGMTSTLLLVGAVSLLLLTLIGYVSSSGKIPYVACALALSATAILHNGKPEMRAKYWDNDYIKLGISDLPNFFTEWVEYGLDFSDDAETKVTAKLIDRTSLFHIMCLVVSATPAQQPFLAGETYKDIPGQFVPRLFWPEKPGAHVSTARLSVYYGLQSEEDTAKTTIGFGMVTEGYANYGFWGVAGVAAFLALLIKKMQSWGAESPLFSYGGLLLVLLMAWSFQVEYTVSMWVTSLYQACVAVLIVPFFLRRMFG